MRMAILDLLQFGESVTPEFYLGLSGVRHVRYRPRRIA